MRVAEQAAPDATQTAAPRSLRWQSFAARQVAAGHSGFESRSDFTDAASRVARGRGRTVHQARRSGHTRATLVSRARDTRRRASAARVLYRRGRRPCSRPGRWDQTLRAGAMTKLLDPRPQECRDESTIPSSIFCESAHDAHRTWSNCTSSQIHRTSGRHLKSRIYKIFDSTIGGVQRGQSKT